MAYTIKDNEITVIRRLEGGPTKPGGGRAEVGSARFRDGAEH